MVVLPPLFAAIIVLVAAACVMGMLHAIVGAIRSETDVHDLRCRVAERLEIRRLKLLELHGGGVGDVEILDDDEDVEAMDATILPSAPIDQEDEDDEEDVVEVEPAAAA